MRFLPVYKKFREDVQFLMIYVREAHPTDKWWLAETKLMRLIATTSNNYASYDTKEPKSIKERRLAATACREKLLEDMPVYIDNMDNQVDLAYVAWPTRVYFLGIDGKIQYDSGLGPYGVSPDELEQELSSYLNL